MISPIPDGVTASPFRRLYSMHRYFARRPHNLFAHLVEHYTAPGDVVLDPFFGGGVCAVESVLLDRRAIGFDVNPVAGFITERELAPFDSTSFDEALEALMANMPAAVTELFTTSCPACESPAHASWFEVTSLCRCDGCDCSFKISDADKVGVGTWRCPECGHRQKFACQATTPSTLDFVSFDCPCGFSGTKRPDDADLDLFAQIPSRLEAARRNGVEVPDAPIPDCNMQRESALHKKGIRSFSQLFQPRVLLGWAFIRRVLSDRPLDAQTRWLWFAFSAALRYSNRMVTRNPSWRGDKPLEWAKPGYWFPPTHLEADPIEQFQRRAAAIRRAKADPAIVELVNRTPGSPAEVLAGAADYAVEVRSSTSMPLPDQSIDAVITDPPYGSYVHYADLTNFWSVWLPAELGDGLGGLVATAEEAVISRKAHRGAKTAEDYRLLLERCFRESYRVLKPGGFLVLTFNNREPRAWIALLAAAVKAGFTLPPGGVIFQSGVASYAHTAQSRRKGSIRGDFVYSFVRQDVPEAFTEQGVVPTTSEIEERLIQTCQSLLENGPMTPSELLTALYLESQEYFVQLVRSAGEIRLDELMASIESVELFDSHRRELLERHFVYAGGQWSLAQAA